MSLNPDRLEHLEQTVMAMVVQALRDYRDEAATIFREETDLPQDIAEDVLREAVDSLGVSGIRERLYGKVDVKKAVYAFLPEAHPVALMLDAKAEKRNGDRTATIQMSQTSMRVRQHRSGRLVDEAGHLDTVLTRGDRTLWVVTIVAKFVYVETDEARWLSRIIVACVPNGALQDRYNPTADDTFWLAGRDAPTRGEDFRVRVSYPSLQAKAAWRVQEIEVPDVEN